MEKSKLISIIIPVYNGENFIEECVFSCLHQAYKNFELLIINDGSTDNTKNIICSLAKEDKRIKIFNIINSGVSKARNIGLDNARGEYIIFLDADDLLAIDALKIMVNEINKNNCDMVSFGTEAFDLKPNLIKSVEPILKSETYSENWFLEQFIFDTPHSYALHGKIFKKSLILDTRFEEKQRIHEDNYFLFLLSLKKPKIAINNTKLYNLRRNQNSISRGKLTDKFLDILKYSELKYNLINNLYPQYASVSKNVKIKSCMAFLSKVSMSAIVDAKPYKKYKNDCIKYIKKNKKHFIPSSSYDKKLFKFIIFNLFSLLHFLRVIKIKLKK